MKTPRSPLPVADRLQVNAGPPPFACNHAAFAPLEAAGAPVFRFFLEPAVRAVNFAGAVGYKRVVFAGLSGGGWTTALAAAIDPRIALSVAIAGNIPCDFAHTSVRPGVGRAERRGKVGWGEDGSRETTLGVLGERVRVARGSADD